MTFTYNGDTATSTYGGDTWVSFNAASAYPDEPYPNAVYPDQTGTFSLLTYNGGTAFSYSSTPAFTYNG